MVKNIPLPTYIKSFSRLFKYLVEMKICLWNLCVPSQQCQGTRAPQKLSMQFCGSSLLRNHYLMLEKGK